MEGLFLREKNRVGELPLYQLHYAACEMTFKMNCMHHDMYGTSVMFR